MGKHLLFILAILIAFLIRIYAVDSIPPGLTPDEASLGYNAYSILKTGRDEYGTFMPIIFKSFGDFKPGFYVYTAVPSIYLFGLNEVAVRMPSVIAGVLTVFLVYLITRELFDNKRLAFIAMYVAALNPWLIYFSRGAWEVNLCLTLTLCGIYFFLQGIKRNEKYLMLSAFFFALTLLTYQGAKLSTLIVLGILAVTNQKRIREIKLRYLLGALITGLVVCLPIISSLFNNQTGRLQVFSVFSYPRPEQYLTDFLKQGGEQKKDLTYYLFHSETLNFLRGVLGRYFNHFSGRFLFFEGDWANPRHTPPYQGVLVLGDSLILILGVIYLLKDRISKNTLFVGLWLILAPLPAILSRDQVHAVRSFSMAIPLTILIALGSFYVITRMKKVFVVGAAIFYLMTYMYFLDSYFVHTRMHNSKLWQYGYKEMVEEVGKVQGEYETIRIQQSYDQPYIYFLFYQKYDPAKYQKQAGLKLDAGVDVGHVERLENIIFTGIDWSRERGNHGELIIADTLVIPPLDSNDEKQFKLIKEIKYLNGETAWRILKII